MKNNDTGYYIFGGFLFVLILVVMLIAINKCGDDHPTSNLSISHGDCYRRLGEDKIYKVRALTKEFVELLSLDPDEYYVTAEPTATINREYIKVQCPTP